jgi:hypothetical protein
MNSRVVTDAMTGELITLPVRIGLRGTRLALRVAEGATDRAIATTFRLAGVVLGARQRRPSSPPAPVSVAPTRGPGRPRTDVPRVRPASPPGNGTGELASERLEREGLTTTLPSTAVDISPEHVSEEPELVAETAEPGAEEGAGASVTVREPWEGYASMNARTVISRLAQATAAELAAVELYEGAHRARSTVLEAAERELRGR